MSDNAALVLIICVMAVTAGTAIYGAIRGAVQIVGIVKNRATEERDRGPRLRG